MSKKEKLIERLMSQPKDFTFDEAVQLMGYFGYNINAYQKRYAFIFLPKAR